ncbi:MAG: sulfatase-like hydrolase/transferase [Verrucomicrobiota bacterium]
MIRFLCLLSLLDLAPWAVLSGQPPNILLILTDDQGYGDLALHGNTVARTPHLDRLGQQSMRFDQFHVTPVCATTRASLLTGKNHLDVGVWGVHVSRDYLHLDEVTVADVLQERGYDTGYIGKWHSGRAPAWMPWHRGFADGWVADLYQHHQTEVSHNGSSVQLKGWADESLTQLAMDYIDERERPFFLMLSYLSIHTPIEAPASLTRKYREAGHSPYFSELNGMLENLDAQIGRLLAHLDQKGLSEETVVIFTSDNGPIHRDRTQDSKLAGPEIALRCPQRLKGVKGNIWQNALRVPCFIRWPGKIRPATIEALTDVTDLFPTLLDLAGVGQTKAREDLAGLSLVPFLAGRQEAWPQPRELFRSHWEVSLQGPMNKHNVLVDKHDLQYDSQIAAWRKGPYKFVQLRSKSLSLYDVMEDPREKEDLLAAQPELAAELARKTEAAFRESVARPHSFVHPRFHIGHPEYDRYARVGGNLRGSQIPCGGGIRMTGGVRAENLWSENWKAAGDSQTFPVEVVTAGRYQVFLEARGGKAGATFRLEIGSASLENQVQALGDRRALGTIQLATGMQEMTLSLVEPPPGGQKPFEQLRVIELRKQ